jgi:iron complex outermembrane receptor protein
MKLKHILLCGCSIVLGAGVNAAETQLAATEALKLEEITVTARRQSENLQRVPVSVSALSPADIERLNVTSVDKLGQVIPNVAIVPIVGSPTGSIAFIRGIGNSDPLSSIDPPVGQYLDGVYIGRGTAGNFELVDLERIEVLRGPQGTLFGRNTTGGAINMVTKAPAKEMGAELKGGYGTFNEWYTRGRFDTGEIYDTGLSATISLMHKERGGIVDNPAQPSSRDPGAFSSDSIWFRGHGEWDKLTLDYTVDYTRLVSRPTPFQIGFTNARTGSYYAQSPTNGGAILVVDPTGRRDTLTYQVTQPQRTTIMGHSITAQYEFNEYATLKSITAYRDYDRAGPLPYGPGGLRGLTATGVQEVTLLNSDIAQKQHQYSEELQLLGTAGEFSYLVGFYFFSEKSKENATTRLTSIGATGVGTPIISRSIFTSRAESYAGFGQLTYTPGFMDNKLELAVGLRQSHDRKELEQVLAVARNPSRNYNNFSFNTSATYQWTPDISTYARVGTGYRSGGFNARASATAPFLFDPEKATVYEGGIKSTLLDQRLRINASVFYTDYKDLQVTQFVGTTAAGGAGFILNANADYKGFEFEMRALPLDSVQVYGNIGFVDPEYSQIFFPNPANTAVLENYANIAHFPYVPKWTISAGAEYNKPMGDLGDFNASIDYVWNSKRWFHTVNLANVNPFNDEIADPGHGIFNTRLGLSEIPLAGSSATLSINFWVQNLLNTEYRSMGIEFGPSQGFAGNVWGLPRTMGIDMKVNF